MHTVLPQNKLLQQLSDEEQQAIMRHSKTIDMEFGQVLCEEGKNCGYVYFPLSGFISILTSMQHNQGLEVGLIGNEGMLGALSCVGVHTSPVHAVVQGNGTALQIETEVFATELKHSLQLQQLLQHYLAFYVVQLTRLVCCNHYHETEPRLARWLLMTHDRAGGDQFFLTHQYLASMLGVRRSSVTEAAGSLLQKKIIDYHRGQIHILNRAALEKACCSCYRDLLDKQQLFLPDLPYPNTGFVR
ncbi:Crp/Fnr family transcriptional regulator [Rheinheimera soli]|uniref:Crp/Fnr family transcriptional regulator n=1 Tax=Rheinheimera soli TaxID=443616 RepID=UPI001E5ED273|nr:Crp/Fnr family transcriptional regulator [Rheinheimera soli]